jgi:uncharacterized protein with PQ loop repeat
VKQKKLFFLADHLIYAAAIISPLALLPQVYEVYSTHEVAGLSLITWSILSFINIIWLVYGLGHKENPIILTNLLSFVCNVLVVCGIVLYR